MVVKTALGTNVFIADADLSGAAKTAGAFEGIYTIPDKTLRPNNYSLSFALFVPHQQIIELVDDAVTFSVYDAGTKYAQSEGVDYGLIFSPGEWSIKAVE